MPQIYNKRTATPAELADAIYVGRPSPFGNPFLIGRHINNTRAIVIENFENWIRKPHMKDLRNRIRRELRGRNLVCWCAPLDCHASILATIASEEIEA